MADGMSPISSDGDGWDDFGDDDLNLSDSSEEEEEPPHQQQQQPQTPPSTPQCDVNDDIDVDGGGWGDDDDGLDDLDISGVSSPRGGADNVDTTIGGGEESVLSLVAEGGGEGESGEESGLEVGFFDKRGAKRL